MKNHGAKDFLAARFAELRAKTPIASVTQTVLLVSESSLDLGRPVIRTVPFSGAPDG